MTPARQARLSRRDLRLGLAGLCGFTGLALVQVLLIPRQPPLPAPPTADDLPQPWNAAAQQTIDQARGIGLLQGNVARGLSQRFSRDGTWLILTPIATWQLKDLDPAAFTKGQAAVQLKRPKLLSLESKRLQMAIGHINGAPAAQTCLTPKGTMAFSTGRLIELSRHPDPGFLAKARQSLLPSNTHGYSCLLITTNSPALLQLQPASSQLLKALTTGTNWPR